MMPIEAPPPRLCLRRVSKQAEVIAVLVHDCGRLDELPEEAVDAHGGEGFGVAFGGEGGGKDGEDGGAEGGGEFVEAETFVAEEELGVRPGAPFGAVDVVGEALDLFRGA